VKIRYAIGSCSLGRVGVARNDRGICAVKFGDGVRELEERLRASFPDAALQRDQAGLADALHRVEGLIEDPEAGFDLPVDARGTPFQQRVWKVLATIPPGYVISYGELARRAGRPTAARAVAQACGANPVPVLIPCHRVIRSSGELGGFGAGIERKIALLEREGVTFT